MFEVTTLGQPLEVLKTQMAANRSQTMGQAARNVWGRGGVFGFYQGLIPWVRQVSLLSRHLFVKLEPVKGVKGYRRRIALGRRGRKSEADGSPRHGSKPRPKALF